MNDAFAHALKLLARRDYSVAKMRQVLNGRFGGSTEDVIQLLIQKHYLNDRRFAEAHVSRHKDRGQARLRQELLSREIPEDIVEGVLSACLWPSLRQTLKDTMDSWHLRAPLRPRDAARLFRTLARLGYEEDAIREEIEQLTHD